MRKRKAINSKGEKEVADYLKEHQIKYKPQYKIPIDKAINKTGKAYLDFYLPKYKIAIEYNGRQHYEYVPYFHRDKAGFKRQQLRNQWVRKYCDDHGIRLLEIKYNVDVTVFLNDNLWI